MRKLRMAVVAAVAGVALTACGSAPQAAPTGDPSSASGPSPAGPQPSESAQEACGPEGQGDIDALLRLGPQQVDAPTWNDHLYACRYRYPQGSFVVSVKELSSEAETTAYVDGLGARLGHGRDIPGLGEPAFATADGSVVMRKDWKVLLVDVSGLPPRVGDPPLTPSNVGVIVTKAVIGCWTGE